MNNFLWVFGDLKMRLSFGPWISRDSCFYIWLENSRGFFKSEGFFPLIVIIQLHFSKSWRLGKKEKPFTPNPMPRNICNSFPCIYKYSFTLYRVCSFYYYFLTFYLGIILGSYKLQNEYGEFPCTLPQFYPVIILIFGCTMQLAGS